MIFKIACGIILVLSFSLVGIKMTEKKKFTKEFFEKLRSFNLELCADVGLYYSPLSEMLSDFNCETDGVIDGFKVIFCGEKYVCKDKRLNERQRDFVSEYVNSLGRFDEKGQIRYQDKTDIRIEDFLRSSCEEYKKYSALAFKLAFCLGLTVFIVIV